LSKNVLEQSGLQPPHIHEVVVVIIGDVPPISVENAGVICQQICLVRPYGREWFSPKLHANLPLWCDRACRQSSLDRVQSSVRSGLLQAKGRFPLTHLDLCPWELMPVDKNVRGLERRSVRVEPVAVFKIAFNLEIKLLGKIASEIDSCAAQAETILQRRLTKAAFERRDITVFEIH